MMMDDGCGEISCEPGRRWMARHEPQSPEERGIKRRRDMVAHVFFQQVGLQRDSRV
jgi:hypothetical protein